MPNYNIKETSEMVVWLCRIIEAGEKSLKKRKVRWMDLPKFMPILTGARAALVGANKIPKELLDLNEDEKQQLIELVKTELKVENEVASKLVNHAMRIILSIFTAITDLRDARLRANTEQAEALKAIAEEPEKKSS